MREILNLISTTNNYMSAYYNAKHYNHVLMRDIGTYITNLLTVTNFQAWNFVFFHVYMN